MSKSLFEKYQELITEFPEQKESIEIMTKLMLEGDQETKDALIKLLEEKAK